MTTAVASEFTLTEDELQVVLRRVGVHSIPTVLSRNPRYGTYDQMETAFDHATIQLSKRGLIVDGQVEPDLIALVRRLQRPDRELAMRFVTPEGTARVAVLRTNNRSMLARRIGETVLIRDLGAHGELQVATKAILSELLSSESAQIEPVGAPFEAIRDALNGTHDPAIIADKIRTLGTDQRTAMALGAVLATRMAFAEIVYYALDLDEERVVRAPAAVGVFYTKRGRLVSAPSMAPNGHIWTTVKGGSNHAISQAIDQLVELLPEGWGENS